MKTKYFILSLIFIFSLGFSVDAQSSRMKKADYLFEKLEFPKAIKVYKKLYKKEKYKSHSFRRLAEAYRLTGNPEESEKWYSRLIEGGEQKAIDLYYYSEVLKMNAKYEKSEKYLRLYTQKSANDKRAKSKLESSSKIKDLKTSAKRYSAQSLNINSDYSDFGAFVWEEALYFSTARNNKALKKDYSWNQEPYLDIVYGSIREDGSIGELKSFPSSVNTRFHESSIVFSPDGQSAFFTRNNFLRWKAGTSSGGDVNLKIYQSKLEEGKWTKPESLPFNSNEFSSGHPTLSPDGKTMIFSSDRSGGLGGSDLYISKLVDGKWTSPQNLGNKINTAGNESFPFYHNSGRLFFASDGHPGLGGLDIFYADSPNNPSSIKNAGSGINSSHDDFGIYFNKNLRTGYISSNRGSGKLDDNIYSFTFKAIILQGFIMDQYSGEKIPNASVVLKDSNGEKIAEVTSDENGEYMFSLNDFSSYSVLADKRNYLPKEESIEAITFESPSVIEKDILLPEAIYRVEGIVSDKTTELPLEGVNVVITAVDDADIDLNSNEEGMFKSRVSEETEYIVTLEKEGYYPKEVSFSTVGMEPGVIYLNEFLDLGLEILQEGLVIELENIYYDYNKWNIRSDASTELDKLVELMKKYPSMVIELGSHTDSRGTTKYNQRLSQKRAESVVRYLISRGINKDRLVAKGYGESLLKNQCGDGVKCSEELHQMNRRTEFRILRMK